MSTNDKRNNEDQEIDLSLLSEKIGGLFQGISRLIFNGIQFILKHIVVIAILFFIGAGLGIYADKTQKIYDHEIIVQPNFGSTDYLYSKIELLESKIRENDTVFLKAIGITDPSGFARIKIEPIVDIYRFIGNSANDKNFELLKLMAEDGDMKKIVEDKTTSKNYTYHIITVTTRSKVRSADILEPLMKYFNSSEYFNKLKDIENNNTLDKIKHNDEIITQIDGFLSTFSSNANGSNRNDKLVYYNENTQLNDVINTKNGLINESGRLRVGLVITDEIIKTSSIKMNILNTGSIKGKLKLVLPVLFVFIYVSILALIGFYKRQSAKNKES